MDDERAGVQDEERLVDLACLDLDLLLHLGLAVARDDDVVARFQIGFVGSVFGGDVVATRAVGFRLVDFPGIAVGDRITTLCQHRGRQKIEFRFFRCGRRGGSRRRFGCWRGSRHCLDKRVLQRFLVGRLDIFAAGVVGQAGDLLAFVSGKAKADDVGSEIDAGRFQFLAERARVAAARLQPVGDEYDGGLVLGVFQRFGGLLDGRRQRRLAEELQTVGGGRNGACRACLRRHDQLDVVAAAFFAMAIGHEADFLIVGGRLKHGSQRLAGDFELGLAVDLRPHRAGGIENDDDLVRGEAERRHRQKEDRRSDAPC